MSITLEVFLPNLGRRGIGVILLDNLLLILWGVILLLILLLLLLLTLFFGCTVAGDVTRYTFGSFNNSGIECPKLSRPYL